LPLYHPQNPIDASWFINVRIIPAFSREYQFAIVVNRDGSVTASAAMPSVSNVYYQLLDLKERHPDATLDELYSTIEIKRWQVTEKSELKELAKQWESLEIKGPLEDPELICMDGTNYEFSIKNSTNEKTVSIGCYSGKTPTLVLWAEKVRRVLNRYTRND
jgi:hypothetical protein